MDKKLLKLDISKELRSWHPVVRDYWWIKFSNYKGNILLIVGSTLTGQVVVRHYADENKACDFVNWIIEQDPSKSIKIPDFS